MARWWKFWRREFEPTIVELQVRDDLYRAAQATGGYNGRYWTSGATLHGSPGGGGSASAGAVSPGTAIAHDSATDTYTVVCAGGSSVRLTAHQVDWCRRSNVPLDLFAMQMGQLGAQHQGLTAQLTGLGQAIGLNSLGGGLGGVSLPPFPFPLQAPAPPPPLRNDGIKVGEIIAYRGWGVETRYAPPLRLCSIAMRTLWEPGKVMTADTHPANGPDVTDHGSGGVYAFKTMSDAWVQLVDSCSVVLGTVKLWGQIVEHERGYRAQFAKMVSLDCPAPFRTGDNPTVSPELLAALRREYGLAEPKAP